MSMAASALKLPPIETVETWEAPEGFTPRWYQAEIWNRLAYDQDINRAYLVWHRRAGKDRTLFNITVLRAMERKGIYHYFLPTYRQGRSVIWEGIDARTGMNFLDHIPERFVKRKDKSEMLVELVNGSIIQILASDQYNRIVGTNPIGVVFSEFALQHPRAWDYIRPILAENGGWAVFVTTPRGHNHAYDLWELVRDNPDWYTQILTADDTEAISQTDIEFEKLSGMSDELIDQEFYCSFEGSIHGAYYSKLIAEAREAGRIGSVPYDPALPVQTWWDIGYNDTTAIWFTQIPRHGREIRVIDFYENAGADLGHYLDVLETKRLKRKFRYDEKHNAPHDFDHHEYQTGMTRKEFARGHGYIFEAGAKESPLDGIQAVRSIMPKCYFDEEHCDGVGTEDAGDYGNDPDIGMVNKKKHGIRALENYRKEWDEERLVFKMKPLHDWCSNPADAFRVLAVNHRHAVIRRADAKDRRGAGKAFIPDHDPLAGARLNRGTPKPTRRNTYG